MFDIHGDQQFHQKNISHLVTFIVIRQVDRKISGSRNGFLFHEWWNLLSKGMNVYDTCSTVSIVFIYLYIYLFIYLVLKKLCFWMLFIVRRQKYDWRNVYERRYYTFGFWDILWWKVLAVDGRLYPFYGFFEKSGIPIWYLRSRHSPVGCSGGGSAESQRSCLGS